MITEDYVSFKIAKLLKEKGFDGKCDLFGRTDESELIIREAAKIAYEQGIDDECVILPTLQMAMKWLREAHNIDIIINVSSKDESYDKRKYTYVIVSKWFIGTDNVKRIYEEACEAGIEYCLENVLSRHDNH